MAFKDLGWEGLEKKVEGTSAISTVRGEVTTVCKLLATFSKDHEGFILQGGLVAGQIVSKEDVNALAKLPARHVLLSQLAGVIQSPLRSLAYLMQAPLRSLVLVLNAVQQRKPAAAPDGEEKAS